MIDDGADAQAVLRERVRARDDKIAELEHLLAERAREGQKAVQWANHTMEFLDRVLEKLDQRDDGDAHVIDVSVLIKIVQKERAKGGILLPRPMEFLAKYGINRFNP